MLLSPCVMGEDQIMRSRRVAVFLVAFSLTCFDAMSQGGTGDSKKLGREAGRQFDKGKFREALELTERALRTNPKDYRLREVRCWCLLKLAKRDPEFLQKAAASFDDARTLRSPGEHSPRFLLGLGLCHMGLAEQSNTQNPKATADNLKHARAAFEQLSESGQFRLDAHAHLLQVCQALGDTKSALQHGKLAIQAYQTQRDYWKKNEARTRHKARKQQITKEVQNLDRRSYSIRIAMAESLQALDRHSEAAKQLDEAIRTLPTESRAWYRRAKAKETLKQPTAAASDFAQFLLRKDLSDKRVVLDCIVSLRGCSADAGPAVAPLADLAANEQLDVELRCEAITTLGVIGPAATSSAKILRDLSKHKNRKIAAVAAATLRQVGRKK